MSPAGRKKNGLVCQNQLQCVRNDNFLCKNYVDVVCTNVYTIILYLLRSMRPAGPFHLGIVVCRGQRDWNDVNLTSVIQFKSLPIYAREGCVCLKSCLGGGSSHYKILYVSVNTSNYLLVCVSSFCRIRKLFGNGILIVFQNNQLTSDNRKLEYKVRLLCFLI